MAINVLIFQCFILYFTFSICVIGEIIGNAIQETYTFFSSFYYLGGSQCVNRLPVGKVLNTPKRPYGIFPHDNLTVLV